ncbi:MAG: hypothetical protein AAB686_03580 [Patescibacteria group bacterium]
MPEIKWSAPEFEYRHKEASWYWTSIIITLLVLAVAIWQKNFLFGFFVVIAEVLIIVWGNRQPRMIDFLLNDKGFTVDGKKFYSWSQLGSFSTEESDSSEWADVILNFGQSFRPAAKAYLPKTRFQEIRARLGQFLSETERRESLVDSLQKFLGF